MDIITRSGRKLSDIIPIGVEQVEELASEIGPIIEDEEEKLNPVRPVRLEVTENSQVDEGQAKGKEVIMPPKFQPTKGGARRRVERADTTHHLRDENIYCEGGDNTLAKDRVVLVASLVLRFLLNMGAIITEERMWRAVRLSTSLPFPCLMTRLCREAHVPIFAGIDVESYSTRRYDLEKSKDESRYEFKLHKIIPEVFRPNGQTARATETSTKLVGEAIGAELVCQAALIHISTLSTSSTTATQLERELSKTSSAIP
ncbi:hypothetical protein HAX54_045137 [Datura stramonium]|uniref:Uncharacterized protein n=1 Tax=Datura stramonium TaxID=4076 RepID=A0ABS8WKB3_DATST|nr:hypothetical protein [Datura stramonium]